MHKIRKFICLPLLDMAFVFLFPKLFAMRNLESYVFQRSLHWENEEIWQNEGHILLSWTCKLSCFRQKCPKMFTEAFTKNFLIFSCLKEETSHSQLSSIWPSFCHIYSCCQCNVISKIYNIRSSSPQKLQHIWKNKGHIQQRRAYELSGFMHKTLLKPLPKVKKVTFWTFCEVGPSKSDK